MAGAGRSRILAALITILSTLTAPVALADTVSPARGVNARVNVRERPSLDAPVVGSLAPGQSADWVSELPGWRRVRLVDGTVGYVSASWTVRAPVRVAFRVAIADVGTGLAVFVRGADFALVYDGGSNDDSARGNGNRFAAFLAAFASDLKAIDYLILSHPHRGHVELLADLFARYQVRNVFDSGAINPICGYHSFIDAVAREPGVTYRSAHSQAGSRAIKFGTARECYGVELPREIFVDHREQISSDRTISLGAGASLRVLHADGSRRRSFDDNSIVVRLDLAGARVLLVGDATAGRVGPGDPPVPNSVEGKLLAWRAEDLAADVLVVGNHGAAASSHPAFLDAVDAEVYVISAGPEPYDGRPLPDAAVLEELDRRGQVLRTDFNDATCGGDPSKIGRDADGRPGGCDNVVIEVDPQGRLYADYWRRAD